MTVYLAGLQDIHKSLYEAAQLDRVGDVPVHLPDGIHVDQLNDTRVEVRNGQMRLETQPGRPPGGYKPFYSILLDYRRHHSTHLDRTEALTSSLDVDQWDLINLVFVFK